MVVSNRYAVSTLSQQRVGAQPDAPPTHTEVYSRATASLAGCLQALTENIQGGLHLGESRRAKGQNLNGPLMD